MTYRGHITGGALAAVAAVRTAPYGDQDGLLLGLAVLAALLGGLAPDLDAPGAFLSRRLGPFYWLARSLFSNPLTWYLAGAWGGDAKPPRQIPWILRLLTAPPLRWLCGDGGDQRTVQRLALGRARVLSALGHRNLSHAFVGLGTAATGFAAASLLTAWLFATRWTAPPWLAILPFSRAALPEPFPSWLPWHVRPALLVTQAFALGYLSHIVLDMCTVSGVPLLLPWTTRRFYLLPRFMRIRSS